VERHHGRRFLIDSPRAANRVPWRVQLGFDAFRGQRLPDDKDHIELTDQQLALT